MDVECRLGIKIEKEKASELLENKKFRDVFLEYGKKVISKVIRRNR